MANLSHALQNFAIFINKLFLFILAPKITPTIQDYSHTPQTIDPCRGLPSALLGKYSSLRP